MQEARASDAWERLKRQIADANPDVQDSWDVAALVESLGWTDGQSERTFGYVDVFALADRMYLDLTAEMVTEPLPLEVRHTRKALWQKALRDLGHGLTFTLPMLVSVAAMITLHISLAAYQNLPVSTATAIALATFFSFLSTGGLGQAMTNIYYVLLNMQKVDRIIATLFTLLRWGIWSTLVFALALVAVDQVYPFMPVSLMGITVVYWVVLSLLWLSFTSLYILRREYWLTLIVALAILAVYALFRLGWPMILAQSAAMVGASLVTLAVAIRIFRQSVKRLQHEGSALPTRFGQLAHSASPYFLYGVLYFLFIFVDRLVAWSSHTAYLPYTIWFRGQYELGMDWSLAALIVPLSVVEVVSGQIMGGLERLEHRVRQNHLPRSLGQVRWMYGRYLVVMAIFSIAGVLASHAVVHGFAHEAYLRSSLPATPIEAMVFTWSTWAYALVGLGLFNILLLFSLSFPRPALQILLYSTIIDAAAGLLATHLLGHYQDAVWGLMAGAVFLFGASIRAVFKLLPHFDFLLYRLT